MSAGIPSDLLVNRPDIKKASLEIEMRKLDLKVAKAQFYPSIGLRAGLGFEAFKSNYLFNAPASVFKGVALDLVGPLINRNAIKAHFKTANSKQIQAMFDYQKVVLSAFIEVANQWSKMDNLRESYTLKEAQVNALTHSIGISLKLFQSARAEYTEVLLVQREALESKMELVETKKEQLVSRVKMYQALGGGWKK
jgi:multidrug efflux system outer membrane protein